MKAIVAVDEQWAIGHDNKLLFSLPTDTRYFRSKTVNKVIVIGHSTLQTFPDEKPLPDRTNVILSRNLQLTVPGAIICRSLEELTLYLQQYKQSEIVLVGGETVYRQLLDYCETVYVTKIQSRKQADSFFPNLDTDSRWELLSVSPPQEENGVTFTFNEYQNKQVKSLSSYFTPYSFMVRSLKLGVGRPKICIPLVTRTLAELIKECDRAVVAGADIVEWRADYFEDLTTSGMQQALADLRASLGNVPLLFTLRTKEEGGMLTLPVEEYHELIRTALATDYVDLVDLELSRGKELVASLVKEVQNSGCRALVSSHDFTKTPPKEDILATLFEMEHLGADLPKVAVYPRTPADVLVLLSATEEFHRVATTPFITMSMSWLGSVSRISGEFFGSAVTFGAGQFSSAPGQIELPALQTILTLLEEPEEKGLDV